MKMVVCEACARTTGPEVYYRASGFSALRCPHCRLIFVDHMVSVQEEPDNADEFWFDRVQREPSLLAAKKRRFAMQLQFAESSAQRHGGKLLDVGCACGWLLEVASGRGWDVYGLDISPAFLEAASGVVDPSRLFLGTLENAAVPEGSMDLITAIGIIEHVDRPREFIRQIGRILRPGGYVLLETPVSEGLFHRINHVAVRLSRGKLVRPSLSPGGHRYLFNIQALNALLETQGFHVVAMKRLQSPFREITAKFGRSTGLGTLVFSRIVLPGLWISAFLVGMGNQVMILARKRPDGSSR